jgi:hypothetical protein
MRWLITMLLMMVLVTGTGCVFSEDDGVPDSVVVDNDSPPASSTTIIEDNDPPAADTDVDLNVDATP